MTEQEMQAVYDEAFGTGVLDHPVKAADAMAQGVTAVRLREYCGGCGWPGCSGGCHTGDTVLIETVEGSHK